MVLSLGLGGGRVLQVEHSGSDPPEGVVVVEERTTDGVERMAVNVLSVQQGGGPIVDNGGTRSWRDVARSVGSEIELEGLRSESAVDGAESMGERLVDPPVTIALSGRSKCLVMS